MNKEQNNKRKSKEQNNKRKNKLLILKKKKKNKNNLASHIDHNSLKKNISYILDVVNKETN